MADHTCVIDMDNMTRDNVVSGPDFLGEGVVVSKLSNKTSVWVIVTGIGFIITTN